MVDRKEIFSPEFDDDFQSSLAHKLSVQAKEVILKEILRRFYCYVLLSDGVILHPAYIWQSELTHELVFNHLKELFDPRIITLSLGEFDTIKDYICDRVEKLIENNSETMTELSQYLKWDIEEEASLLDEKFALSRRFILTEEKDKKFRNLIVSDLSPYARSTSFLSLRSQIADYVQSEKLKIDLELEVSKLVSFARDNDLVSLDTFTNQVEKLGLTRLASTQSFKDRMLFLYYHANIEEGITHAPALQIIGEQIIDPFDPDVFWAVFGALFGQKQAELLSSSSEPEIVRFMLKLWHSDEWRNIRSIYFEILKETEVSIRNNKALILKKLKHQSGYADVHVLKRFWRERKIQLVMAVFGLVSVMTFSALSFVGAVPVIYSLNSLYKSLRRFRIAYDTHDITRIRKLIDAEIERILEYRGL